MSSKREVWVDYVKVFACVLVVLGHFFQSMVKANILPENDLYDWFNTTIYYFHVPLFFICSGYLYQKYSVVDSWPSWKWNIIKKAAVLGIPYFVFSFATWLLKTVFAGAVNTEIGGLGYTLFIHPIPPYWYLYILFLIFCVTPTVNSTRGAVVMAVLALLAKVAKIIGGYTVLQIYAVSNFTASWIWFVLGMMIAVVGTERLRQRGPGFLFAIAFFGLSILLYKNENGWIAFGLGLFACTAVLMIAVGMRENQVLNIAATYTMPIFLMHTLFAAPVRTVLMKVGMSNGAVHVAAGIVISFFGPVVAMKILQVIKLDWLVYPGRLPKKRK